MEEIKHWSTRRTCPIPRARSLSNTLPRHASPGREDTQEDSLSGRGTPGGRDRGEGGESELWKTGLCSLVPFSRLSVHPSTSLASVHPSFPLFVHPYFHPSIHLPAVVPLLLQLGVEQAAVCRCGQGAGVKAWHCHGVLAAPRTHRQGDDGQEENQKGGPLYPRQAPPGGVKGNNSRSGTSRSH